MKNKFTLTNSLSLLKEKKYLNNISDNIDNLLKVYDEEQLQYMASNGGIKIDNIIKVSFFNGVGFRCQNEGVGRYGRLPICNNIEKFLNEVYLNG